MCILKNTIFVLMSTQNDIAIETSKTSSYNLNEEEEKKLILRHYRALLKQLGEKLKKGDKKSLRHAFKMSAEAHKSMRRKSGEPYILHPLAVAMICVEEIGLGLRSSICALLHDVVEDTDITIEDIQQEFTTEIAKIVDGLTKISSVSVNDNAQSQQAENFKKFF
jgi:GTP diphosphokinase / guanosine-3',5'-bis(diphosphate) 3'-diphosphatase